MKVKGYVLALIMAGSAFGPICAENTADASPYLEAKIQSTQPADNSTNVAKRANQEPTALQMVGICVAVLLGAYVMDRSIAVAHEGGHTLAAWLAGKKVTEFHISSQFCEGGGMDYAPRGIGLKDIGILLAGPLCGTAAYFAWAKLWDVGRYMLYGNENKEMSLRAKLGGFTVAALGSSLQLKLNLIPNFSNGVSENYAACANSITGNDGEKIRKILVTISPIMGAVFPYITRIGLLAYAGYSAYRIYQIGNELYKKDNQTEVIHEA